MKITDIIVLESWENKFAEIRKEIGNMTLGQVKTHLRDKYDTILNTKDYIGIGDELNVPSASTYKIQDTDTSVIDMKIVGKSNDDMQVKNIPQFFRVLQHEMSHNRQEGDAPADYESGVGGSENNLGWLKYIAQPRERSQQVLDTGEALSGFNLTPKDLDKFIATAIPRMRGDGPNREAYQALFADLRAMEFHDQTSSKAREAGRITSTAIALAYAKKIKDKEWIAKANDFRRQLAKRFKSIDAHAKSNRQVSDEAPPDTKESDFISLANREIDGSLEMIKNFTDGEITPERMNVIVGKVTNDQKFVDAFKAMKNAGSSLVADHPDIDSLVRSMASDRINDSND